VFARVRSRSLARTESPARARFDRTGANGSERSLAFAMQKVVGSSPIIRSEAVVDVGGYFGSASSVRSNPQPGTFPLKRESLGLLHTVLAGFERVAAMDDGCGRRRLEPATSGATGMTKPVHPASVKSPGDLWSCGVSDGDRCPRGRDSSSGCTRSFPAHFQDYRATLFNAQNPRFWHLHGSRREWSMRPKASARLPKGTRRGLLARSSR
jgi:hypothetical protein